MASNGVMTPLVADQQWTKPVPLNNFQQQGYTGLFGPGTPILPVRPEENPRIFQYQPGINLVTIPRSGFNLIPFPMLRNLATVCWQIRLNIELIKREMRALDWAIVPAKEKDPNANNYNVEIDEVTKFLGNLSGYKSFDGFLNAMLEEILVTDALTLWPETGMTDVSLIDGTTIRPLLDFRGRTPLHPTPAYIQYLYGYPTSFFTSDRLFYMPYNSAVNNPYGSTPVELIILIVNLALRRDTYRVGYFTEGNVPEALIGAPSSWTPEQAKTYQEYWDALVSGNIAQQRKMHFIPLENGRGQIPVYEFKKSDDSTAVFDEWLFKIACWACGNSPSEFGLVDGSGLGGSGYAGQMQNVQYRSMFGPMTQFTAKIFNTILQDWLGKKHLSFEWQGIEPENDALAQAQVDSIYITAGVYGPEYVQDREAIPPEFRTSDAALNWPGLGPIETTVEPVVVNTNTEQATSPEVDVSKFFQGRQWDNYG